MDTAGTKDSTTLELHADMKGSTTLVASGDIKVPTASKLDAEMKRRAAETSVAANFTVAPLSVALRSRMPKPASILVLLVGTTTGAPPAATPIEVPRAFTAAGLGGAGFVEVAATVDCISRIHAIAIYMERYIMNETTKVIRKLQFPRLLLAMSMLALSSQATLAQQPNQQVFHSPEEASAALFAAAQQTDNRALLEVLGPAGKDLVSSGDPAEDRKNRDHFVAKYDQMHRVAREREGVMILYIGAENWPDPIPIVEKNGTWYLDTDAGKEEILARRVGRNELATIDVCYELVDAEQQHYARTNNGEHLYAVKFIGDNGGQDGLFSSENAEQSVSPHDALIASAGVENGAAASHDPVPFNGYYFRILKAQGNNAEGGAKNYLVDGKMVSGFAFVAYPAIYRSTGVTTFIVNQNGIVYQKDLGPDTEKIANAMTQYDPDSTWQRVD